MKALVHTEAYKFEVQEVETPAPSDNEILVRVKAVGICGSDIHGATGQTGRRQPPIIMGHEAAGVVEKIGSIVTKFKADDRITFDSTVYCGKCDFCKIGRVNLCDDRKVLGVSCGDYRRHGAMAEYIVVPEHICYHIPDNMTFPQASMVEAVSIAMHAVNRACFTIGDSCAVVGTGLIGLLIVQMLKLRGCGKLIAFDIDDDRLQLAKKFGANETINLKTEKGVSEKDLGNIGVVIEAVGIQDTVTLAVDLARKGGMVIAVGNLAPSIDFALQKIVTREIAFNGSCASAGEYPACIDFIASGRLDIEPLVSKVVALDQGAKYFDILLGQKEKLFKVVLEP